MVDASGVGSGECGRSPRGRRRTRQVGIAIADLDPHLIVDQGHGELKRTSCMGYGIGGHLRGDQHKIVCDGVQVPLLAVRHDESANVRDRTAVAGPVLHRSVRHAVTSARSMIVGLLFRPAGYAPG